MAGSSSTKARPKAPETVDVVVVVNHDDLRRGERGEVELTPTVRKRLERGWLKLADDTTDPTLAPLGATVGRAADVPHGMTTDLPGTPAEGGSDGVSGADNA